nr:MAG TPA: tail protein [Caudoviricetes sp.]
MGNSKIVYYGETLIDLTGDTVEAAKLLKGVTAHDKKGEKITGTLSDVTQATPAITVDAAGKITASATQAAGVVAAGTKSATKQLTVQAAKTVTPSASAQTAVAKGVFTTGIITVAAVYAVIGVTYPSGSTVTCTNGSKTLKAKDTSGKAMFIVPTKGTWTVKAVKGSRSASKAVSITAEGQVETVELSFALQIVKDGVLVSGMNLDGLLRPNHPGTLTQKDGYVEYSLGGSYSSGRAYSFKTKMALYNTLYIDWIPHSGGNGAAIGLASNIGISTEDELKRIFQCSSKATQNNARQTTTLDVSSANSEYYVGFSLFGTSDFTATIRIYNFYLTPGGTV